MVDLDASKLNALSELAGFSEQVWSDLALFKLAQENSICPARQCADQGRSESRAHLGPEPPGAHAG
jgi:hypothetical protein